MLKMSKLAFMPIIASVSFVLAFWITQVRSSKTVFGVSSDLSGGLVFGIGIGLMLALLYSVKKHKT